jgi:hypothetical protein
MVSTSGRKCAAPNPAQSPRSKHTKKLTEKVLVNQQLSKGRGNKRKKKGALEPKSSEWVDTEDETLRMTPPMPNILYLVICLLLHSYTMFFFDYSLYNVNTY